METMTVQTQETETTSKIAKEVWNKPGFETIGVDMTANGAVPATIDTASMS